MTSFATPSKRAAFCAALFLLTSVPAFAQLTITSSQFEQAFPQLVSSQTQYDDTGTAGLQSLINQTGANQTWSFQELPFKLDTTASTPLTIAPYSQSFPEADSFPTATHVASSTSNGNTFYVFYRIDNSGFYILGISGDSMGTPVLLQNYTPPEESFAFPLTYGTQWSSTSVIGPGGYNETEEIDGYVDGWGTYSVPGTNAMQALRIRERTIDGYSYDSVLYYDTSYSFQWLNLSSFSATIDADANQNATRASYATPGSVNSVLNNTQNSSFSISVTSNPVSSPTNVSFTLPSESQVRISLMDPLGRTSQVLMNGMARAGVNMLPLDPANLMNGTYFLRMESAGNSVMQKVIVNH